MRHPPMALTRCSAPWRGLVTSTLLCAVLCVALIACERGTTTAGQGSAASFIYKVNTNRGSQVTAVSSTTGDLLWQSLVAGYVNGAPLIACDVVYTCSYGYGPAPAPPTLTALRLRDGHELWRTTQPVCGDSGQLGADTTALAVTGDGIYVLNPSDGSIRWSKPHMAAGGPPVIGHDAVYTLVEREPGSGSNHLSLYAFALRDGTELWHVPFSTVNTRIFATERAVYGNPDVHTALAVNAGDGRPLWTNAHGGEVIAATEQLALLAQEGEDLPSRQLIAVDATTGQARWRASANLAATWPTSAVMVSGDFITVFHEKDVTQLRTSDGAQLWRVPVDDQH
jgi:outer membrane protein assembly factor BamB